MSGRSQVSGRASWRCLTCGHPATDPIPSLDPAHPLVLCRYTVGEGQVRGCGRVPGTADQDELARVLQHARTERATRQHGRHPARDGRSRDCAICVPGLAAAHA